MNTNTFSWIALRQLLSLAIACVAYGGQFKSQLAEEIDQRFPAGENYGDLHERFDFAIPFSRMIADGAQWRCTSGGPTRHTIEARLDEESEPHERTMVEIFIDLGFPVGEPHKPFRELDDSYLLATRGFVFGGLAFSR
jgi:hypothetical protein